MEIALLLLAAPLAADVWAMRRVLQAYVGALLQAGDEAGGAPDPAGCGVHGMAVPAGSPG